MPNPDDVEEDTLERRDEALALSLRVDTVEDAMPVSWVELFEGLNDLPRAHLRLERPENLENSSRWVGRRAVLQVRRRGKARSFRGLVVAVEEPATTRPGTANEAATHELSVEVSSVLHTLSPDDLIPRLEGSLEEALTAMVGRLRADRGLDIALRTRRRLQGTVPTVGAGATSLDRLNALCAAGGLHWFVDHDGGSDHEVIVLSDGDAAGRSVVATVEPRGTRTVLSRGAGDPHAVTSHRFESESLELAAGVRVEGEGLRGSAVVTQLHATGRTMGDPEWRALVEVASGESLAPAAPALGIDLRKQPDGMVSLRNPRGIRLESQGCTVTLRNGQVSIESPEEVVLTSGASQIRLSPSGVEVQGTTVKSHSSGLHQTTGLVVKIN